MDDPQPGADDVALERVEAVGPAVPVRALGVGDGAVEGDQPHLHRDLARRRVGVRHDDEQPSAVGEPVADAAEHEHGIVEVLERVHQKDGVVSAR